MCAVGALRRVPIGRCHLVKGGVPPFTHSPRSRGRRTAANGRWRAGTGTPTSFPGSRRHRGPQAQRERVSPTRVCPRPSLRRWPEAPAGAPRVCRSPGVRVSGSLGAQRGGQGFESLQPGPKSRALGADAAHTDLLRHQGPVDPLVQTAGDETHAAFGRRSIPAKQPVMEPTRRSAGDPSRLNRVAARRSSLRFGRNTPGIPPSHALSAGRLAGLGAHAGSTTGRSPRRCAPLIVALRSEYTRYSSLTRLVSRAPRRPRRSRGFHHRPFTTSLRAAHRCASVEIHPVFLPHAPCQPGASPASALTRVPPPAVTRGSIARAACSGLSRTRRQYLRG